MDTTFGGGGTVHFNIQNGGGYAVAAQADGKVIVAGGGNLNTGGDDFLLVRFNVNGTLDTTFGTNGLARTRIFTANNLGSSARDLIIQPDGKIIAVGNAAHGSFIPGGPPYRNEVAVVRYNTNGSLDTSFDGDGIATTLVNGADGQGFDGELQADGKIVIAEAHFAILRFNTNGSLDSAFGNGGIVQTDFFGGGNSRAGNLRIQPDGKIVVLGRDHDPNQSFAGFAVMARYSTNGSLDPTFDSDGKLIFSTTDFDTGNGFTIQPDAKMVVVGTIRTGSGTETTFGLMRLMPNGTFDPSFGTGGKVSIPNFPFGSEIGVQTDGKIVVAGNIGSRVLNTADLFVARFLPNGSIDTSFANDGFATADILGHDFATGIVIQPDGKVVVGGQSESSTPSLHLSAARFHANSDAVADFDGDGKTDVGIFRPGAPNGAEWWYQRSSNAQVAAVQFGTSTDKIVPGDFTGDGKADIAFWRPSDGHWFVLRSEDSTYFAFPFGSNGDIPAPADYDGDGRTDPAVFRPTTTTWFISNSGGSGTSIVNFGISTDKPVVADYDGDAKADIAIWRAGPGEWWGLRSTNGSVFAVQFGVTSDRPVQGDYTGDGKADISFWRPTDGNWYIIRSEDSSYFAFPFGSNGDVPVPGDYDGDGRQDAAVFRPSNATWFLNRSTAGIAIQQFGLPTDTPIPSAYLP